MCGNTMERRYDLKLGGSVPSVGVLLCYALFTVHVIQHRGEKRLFSEPSL